MATTSHFSNIRRARASYSCESCRRRRVKCDKSRPTCGNCERNNVRCTYPGSQAASDWMSNEKGRKLDAPGGTSYNVGGDVGDAKSFQPGYLVLLGGGRSRYTESGFWGCVDTQGLEMDAILPKLPLFPSSSDDHPSEPGTSTTSPVPQMNTGYANHTNARRLQLILQSLPDTNTCDLLLKEFTMSIHPLIPLLHLPTFEQSYKSFGKWRAGWNGADMSGGILSQNPSILPLIIAVLFTGTISLQEHSQHTLSAEVSPQLARALPRAFALADFPHSPSMYSLMAFILFNSMMVREEEAFSSSSFVAMAIRVAQSMGLHRDGTHFDLDPITVEERRRVWWHLLHIDTMSSIMSGLPVVVSISRSDTLPVAVVKDEAIGLDESSARQTSSSIDPNYNFAAGRYDISTCMRSILDAQNSGRLMNLTDIEHFELQIALLEKRIAARIGRIDPTSSVDKNTDPPFPIDREELQWVSSASSHDYSPPLAQRQGSPIRAWNKELLHLTCEKTYCILYQPLMQHKNLWSDLRSRAIPHFRRYLSIYLKLCTEPAFRPFHWLYPGSYQPLQACAVLLVDMFNNPTSSDAQTSRSLIDETFSLTVSQGRFGATFPGMGSTNRSTQPMSTGARQVWTVLEKLRFKVWTRLGLDPLIFWNQHSEFNEKERIAGPMEYWAQGNMVSNSRQTEHFATEPELSMSSNNHEHEQNDSAIQSGMTSTRTSFQAPHSLPESVRTSSHFLGASGHLGTEVDQLYPFLKNALGDPMNTGASTSDEALSVYTSRPTDITQQTSFDSNLPSVSFNVGMVGQAESNPDSLAQSSDPEALWGMLFSDSFEMP